MKGLYFIPFLFLSCSASKKLVVKENTAIKQSDSSYIRETITEPLMSSIELPLESSDARLPPKRYLITSGKTKIKAEVRGKSLKLTTTTQKQSSKDSLTQKIVTQDKLIYKDKLIKVAYIPKWVYILIAVNVVFVGWKLKRFLPF